MCQEKYAEHLAEQGLAPPEDPDDFANGVVGWIKARAEVHKTFALWKQFLLDQLSRLHRLPHCPANGNFNLRCDALHRIAKVFYITGKDRYQFLVADHLAEMAILPESDRKVIAELFSVAWSRCFRADCSRREAGGC